MEEDNSRRRPDHARHTPPDGGSSPSHLPSARVPVSVGRQPAGDAGAPGAFPAGIEQVLTLAALDDGFRAALREDRDAAVRGRGIELTPAEVHLLNVMPGPVLEHAIDQVLVPTSSRRGFIKAASNVALMMLAGGAAVTGIGAFYWKTGGIRPDATHGRYRSAGLDLDEWMPQGSRPDARGGSYGPGDYWISLAGHTALLHVPPTVSSGGAPLVLLFHEEGRTVVDAVRPWRESAKRGGHTLVGVKWSGRSSDANSTAAAAGAMLDDLAADYGIRPGGAVVAAGAGTGAAVAFRAALFVEKRFTAAVVTGADALPEWEGDGLVDPKGTTVYAIVTETAAGRRLADNLKRLGEQGVRVHLEPVDGTITTYDATARAWQWITGRKP